MASFIVSFTVSVLAISLCVWLAKTRLGIADPQGLWIELSGVYFLGCSVYAAVFSLIGTYFIKRSMVAAAGYLVGSEILLASVPGALINKLTIRYHLQEIGISWIEWFLPGTSEAEYRVMFGQGFNPTTHVLIIAAITLMSLGLGILMIVNREYITSDET